jgi:hypothetical protein
MSPLMTPGNLPTLNSRREANDAEAAASRRLIVIKIGSNSLVSYTCVNHLFPHYIRLLNPNRTHCDHCHIHTLAARVHVSLVLRAPLK